MDALILCAAPFLGLAALIVRDPLNVTGKHTRPNPDADARADAALSNL